MGATRLLARLSLGVVTCIVAATVRAESPSYPPTAFSMEYCLEKLQAVLPSKVLSLERETKQEVNYYEFEVLATGDKLVWEAECNADTGEIVQIERDVKPDDRAFGSVALVALADAIRSALSEVPGTLKGVEYEVSPDGRAWYEISIRQTDGQEAEVMVDAATGDVLSIDRDEGSRTLYRIGPERE